MKFPNLGAIEMKNLKNGLLMIFLLLAILPMSGIAQDDATKKRSCVVVSNWKDCSQYCAGAKCYQFKNNCSDKVKVTWKSKKSDGTWSTGDIYLNPGEESEDAMFCPYIEMTWSYTKI
jgi:hypothetical protein